MEKELTLKELEALRGKTLDCGGARIKSKKLSEPIRVYCDKVGIGQYGYFIYFFKKNEIIIDFPLQDIVKIELKEKLAKKGKKKEGKKKHDNRTTKKAR